MTARPSTVRRLARDWHLPLPVVRAAVLDLVAHWGRERVVQAYDRSGGMRLTPAAITAVRQNFGLGGGL